MPVAAPKKKAPPSEVTKTATAEESEALDPYGDGIPFADPNWYQSVSLAHFFSEPLPLAPGQTLTSVKK